MEALRDFPRGGAPALLTQEGKARSEPQGPLALLPQAPPLVSYPRPPLHCRSDPHPSSSHIPTGQDVKPCLFFPGSWKAHPVGLKNSSGPHRRAWPRSATSRRQSWGHSCSCGRSSQRRAQLRHQATSLTAEAGPGPLDPTTLGVPAAQASVLRAPVSRGPSCREGLPRREAGCLFRFPVSSLGRCFLSVGSNLDPPGGCSPTPPWKQPFLALHSPTRSPCPGGRRGGYCHDDQSQAVLPGSGRKRRPQGR